MIHKSRKIVTIQPLQSANNIQIIQPLQTRPVFQNIQPVNIINAQPLTVLPIQSVQPLSQENRSISVVKSSPSSSGSILPLKKSTTNSLRKGSIGSTMARLPPKPSKKSKSSPSPPVSDLSETPDPIPKSSPIKPLSLKSRLIDSSPTTPKAPPIKLVWNNKDQEGKKKVIMLKEIPKDEREALLNAVSEPRLRTPRPLETSRKISDDKDRVEKKEEPKKEVKTEPNKVQELSKLTIEKPKIIPEKAKTEPVSPQSTGNSIPYFSKVIPPAPPMTKPVTMTKPTRVPPRKTPTPPVTPVANTTRPTKLEVPVVGSKPASSVANTKQVTTSTTKTTTTSNFTTPKPSNKTWTTKIIDNTPTVLKSLPSG